MAWEKRAWPDQALLARRGQVQKRGFLFLAQGLEFYPDSFGRRSHNLTHHFQMPTAILRGEGQNETIPNGKTETGWDKYTAKADVLDIPAVGSAPAGIVDRQTQGLSVVLSATPALQQAILQEVEERAALIV